MTNQTPAQKKGLPVAAWIAIGCGALIVVSFVVFSVLGFLAVRKGKEMVAEATGSESFEDFVADLQENPAKKAAEAMIALSPELELVSTDDEAGTITFVNTKTGERATLDFEDVVEGRLSVITDDGEYRIDAGGLEEGGEAGITFTGPQGQTRFGASADLSAVPAWVPIYPDADSAESQYHTVGPASVSGMVIARTGDGAEQVIDFYRNHFERGGWTIGSRSLTTTADGSFGAITGELDGGSINVGVAEREGECQVTIQYNGKE